MIELELAQLWQVEQDGQTALQIRIPVPANLPDPTGQEMWRAYVYEALREALKQHDSEPSRDVTGS